MKKLFSILILLLSVCILLCSCGEDSDTPNGFQLASDPESDGYSLYVPEGWKYNHSSGVLCAYVSTLSSGTIVTSYVDTSKTSIQEYWSDAEVELNQTYDSYELLPGESYPKEVVVDNHAGSLFEYHVGYQNTVYRVNQYFLYTGVGDSYTNRLLSLTFIASDVENTTTGTNDYSELSEYYSLILEYFKFNSGEQKEVTDLAQNDDSCPSGMKLASIFKQYGMKFYVPSSWKVTLSDGFVSAVSTNKSSVGLHQFDYSTAIEEMELYNLPFQDKESGFSVVDYWTLLQKEYGDYFQDFTIVSEPTLDGDETTRTPITKSGETSYYEFQFTGTQNGNDYKVSLFILKQTTSRDQKWYVLSYVAKDASFDLDYQDVLLMISEAKY